MATIPESHADLVTKKSFANLATVNADGSPQVTPVWWDSDGTNILINTARGRVKAKNLERNPRVALSIADPETPDDVTIYELVGPPEADPSAGRISNMSPVGKALVGKMAGETVLVRTPRGDAQFVIVAVD